MNLDEMINKFKRHHKVLSVDHQVYPALDRLRKLRNKVHLQVGNDNSDSDYMVFNMDIKREMKFILYSILKSDNVTATDKKEWIESFNDNFEI